MYFNLVAINSEMCAIRERLNSLKIGGSFNKLSIATQGNIDNFLKMFNEYNSKVIATGSTINFNGNVVSEVFTGTENSQLKVTGLNELIKYGRYVMGSIE